MADGTAKTVDAKPSEATSRNMVSLCFEDGAEIEGGGTPQAELHHIENRRRQGYTYSIQWRCVLDLDSSFLLFWRGPGDSKKFVGQ